MSTLKVDTVEASAASKMTFSDKLNFGDVPAYADNAAALLGGLVAGDVYRTGGDPDLLCIVH